MVATAGPVFHRHLEQARAHSVAGRHVEALRELLAAWHMRQEPVVMFNIAVCYEYLQQYPQALEVYRRLTTHPELGPMATERIAQLNQRTADTTR